MRKRMGTIYIYMYMYIFSCTNSDNIYPSGKSAIHCPVFLMSVDLFLLSLLWNFYGISLREGEINSPSFDIIFLVSLSLFFFKSYEIQEKYLKYSRFILLHSILHILPCYKKYFQTRIKTRKNW